MDFNKSKRKYEWKNSINENATNITVIRVVFIILIFLIVLMVAIGFKLRNNTASYSLYFAQYVASSTKDEVTKNIKEIGSVLDKIASRIEIIISEGRFEIVERIFETISYSNNSNAIIYIDVNNNFSSNTDISKYKEKISSTIKHGNRNFIFFDDRSAFVYVPVHVKGNVVGSVGFIYSSEQLLDMFGRLSNESLIGIRSMLLDESLDPVIISDETLELYKYFLSDNSKERNDSIINIKTLMDEKKQGSYKVKTNEGNVFLFFDRIEKYDIVIVTVVPSSLYGINIDSFFIQLAFLSITVIILFTTLMISILSNAKKRIYDMINAAYYDRITGGLNINGFYFQAKKNINNYNNYALVRFSIRDFAIYTSTLGSDEGNRILKCVVAIINNRLAKDELACRVYAENFLLIIHDSEQELLEERLAFLAKSAEEAFNENLAQSNKITISFISGVYSIAASDTDIEALAERVRIVHDVALLDDRRGNITKFYDSNLLKTIKEEKEITDSFAQAIEYREFLVYFQPKVDSNTNEIVGAEALVRWKKGDEILPPSKFIPILEKNGNITELDFYVFEEVCADIRQSILMGYNVVPVSVNLSARHFAYYGIADDLEKIRSSYSIPASLLDIEVTESVFFDKKTIEIVKVELNKMHKYGFACSLDDFGSGYSSLSLLMDFDIDYIKIDKSFIDNINNAKSKVILQSIINLALSLNMGIVAEGVETKEQLEIIKQMGCKVIQGYIYSKPICLEDWIEYRKSFGGGQTLLDYKYLQVK